jgi:TonB family protein
VPPRPLTPLAAAYPEGAIGNAEVIVAVVVNADGSVRSARVVSGADPFAAAAVAASSGWRFDPATRDGKPISVTVRALIAFTAPPPPEPPPASAPPAASTPATPGQPAPPPPPPKALEVTIHGEQPAPGVATISRAEVRLLPGAFGDPFRAIDVLPGVTPLASGLPYFFVRGAPPGNVGYFLDGVRVPLLFHIGLGPSVIHPALMDRVDLYSGGYPAAYGRYAGGIVSGETKAQEPGWHGEANIRIFDAGVMASGSLPGGVDVLVAGRYSYFTPLLDVIHSSVSLGYWDYQARVTWHVTPKDDLTVFAFGAHDFLGDTSYGSNGAQQQETLFDTTFHRLDLRYDHRLGGPEDRLRFAITLGYDETDFPQYCSNSGEQSYPGCPAAPPPTAYVFDKSLHGRVELQKRLGDAVLLRAGVDAGVDVYGAANLDVAFNSCFADSDCGPGQTCNQATHQCPSTVGGFTSLFSNHTDVTVGVRADAVINVTPRLEVVPGVRVDLFTSHDQQRAWSVDPRLAARLTVDKDLRLVSATGLATQAPSFILPGPGFTPDLSGGLQQAFQTSLGVEADLPWDVSGTLTFFRNAFFNMNDALGTAAVPTSGGSFPSDFGSRVNGSSIGMEVLVKRRLTRRLGGLISYTLSRSERILPHEILPSSFDRTHVLNVAGTYDLGHGVRAGTRIVFYTGYPITSSVPGEPSDLRQTGRIPSFGRFDARLEKRWRIFSGRGWVSLVLEGLNVFGAKETLQEQCLAPGVGCNAVQIGPVSIPSIGLEGGF